MPKLVVIRIHPVTPTTGAEFATYLKDLRIIARDIQYSVPQPVEIGRAEHDPTSGPRWIVQHEINGALVPVATAAIVVNELPGRPEFDSLDLSLKIDRAGRQITDSKLHYNVAVRPTTPLLDPDDPDDWAGLEPVGLYLALPRAFVGPDPGLPYIELPIDGSPPPFDDLLEAVETVFAQDPGGMPDLASLTPAQCDHIAHELVWNRHAEPLPEPPRSLEELYTSTTRSGFPEMFIDADRNRFEAEITSYYARHDAEARQLASYIFALSAALYAERKSLNASRVAFRFPVVPGVAPTTGKIVEAEAILTD